VIFSLGNENSANIIEEGVVGQGEIWSAPIKTISDSEVRGVITMPSRRINESADKATHSKGVT
jgi:hypothetical protein